MDYKIATIILSVLLIVVLAISIRLLELVRQLRQWQRKNQQQDAQIKKRRDL